MRAWSGTSGSFTWSLYGLRLRSRRRAVWTLVQATCRAGRGAPKTLLPEIAPRGPGVHAGRIQAGLLRPEASVVSLRARHPSRSAWNAPSVSVGWSRRRTPRSCSVEMTRGQLDKTMRMRDRKSLPKPAWLSPRAGPVRWRPLLPSGAPSNGPRRAALPTLRPSLRPPRQLEVEPSYPSGPSTTTLLASGTLPRELELRRCPGRGRGRRHALET